MWYRKIGQVVLWVTSILLLIAMPIQAASDVPQVLQPEPGSSVIFDELTVEHLPSGVYVVRGKGTHNVDAPPLYARVRVDTKKGTYKTMKLPLTEEKRRELSSLPTPDELQHMLQTTLSDFTALASSYSAEVRLDTKDLPQALIARTTNLLNWAVNTNGTVSPLSSSGHRCQPQNPTFFGTHWYTQYCTRTGPTLSNSNTQVAQIVDAQYYNYDFMDNDKATYAWHWSRISAYNTGNFGYQWDHAHSGEFSGLLEIDVFVNGQKVW